MKAWIEYQQTGLAQPAEVRHVWTLGGDWRSPPEMKTEPFPPQGEAHKQPHERSGLPAQVEWVLDLEALQHWDGRLVGLLWQGFELAQREGVQFRLQGAPDALQSVFGLVHPPRPQVPEPLALSGATAKLWPWTRFFQSVTD